MSYILDALRKSEAERARGVVPGLSAQPPAAGIAGPSPRGSSPWRVPAVAAALAVFAAVLAGWLWPRDAPAPVAVVPQASDPALPVLAAVEPKPEMAAAASAIVVPPAPPVDAAPAPSARVLALSELSADVRRQLPPLRVGGSVYSDQRASRFVMIDGRLLHEGDEVAPGLVVERIGAKSARLRWRGQPLDLVY
jgi:general secretion pathway protein B